MAALRLGPVLRYVGASSATVWVETSRACTAEVRCPGGAGGRSRTFSVAGHHYALITVTGLPSGTDTAYELLLDGESVWPLADRRFPASVIRTPIPSLDTAAPTITAGHPHRAQDTEAKADAPPTVPASPSANAGTDKTAAPEADGRTDGTPDPAGSRTPAPEIGPNPPGDGKLRIAFGSCRWSAPPADVQNRVGPDALDTLAARIAADPHAERPDVLLLLGDQVYADETSEPTQEWLASRRDLDEPPGTQVADFEEYTRLYYESWLDPEVRWLLSTVPSLMIFDDHDVIDDWNTSAAWLTETRAQPWWRERILSGFMTYWIYQHLGNLTPQQLKDDPVYAAVCAEPEATETLRSFAARADARVAADRETAEETPAEGLRWSYRRDFGRVRLLMVDTRAARVLQEDQRAMLGPSEEAWLREQATDEPGSYDHLLIGSSLPWLLPHLVHDAEVWDAGLCRGERGGPSGRWARFGEKLRQAADLEHWSAFPASFDALADLLAEVGSGPGAPATVCVLSGDVHHAYVAEPSWPTESRPSARVLQLTCSPVHNSVPAYMKAGFRFGWSALGRALGSLLLRHARAPRAAVKWRRTGGPWFGNHLMTLEIQGRSARLRLERARLSGTDDRRLETIRETPLS
ncbi:alkaline phosphatase D family protein [Streptomyces physcomitrii]|uniref:Alkaline phosphatase family protein n=1 Tax=Streptomyces physcomitrii TaxID=2724184 RepID=A0ABX1H3X9_9ACTN|nr:alkaline phosphatase D family protein [Streptomyces physcomitrii]NKI43078.1 alkaline phosphatase family protein [Streptomyces physcomitrii]